MENNISYIQGDPDQDANPLEGGSLVHKTKKIVWEGGGGILHPDRVITVLVGAPLQKK